MFVRLVLWDLDGSGTTIEGLRAYLRDGAARGETVPGLRLKLWISEETTNRWGAVYLWESRAAADRERLRTVYPGMDARPFHSVGEAGSRSVGEETAQSPPSLVWVGRIEPTKDLIGLLHDDRNNVVNRCGEPLQPAFRRPR
jgi:hypothetical protein